MKIKTGTLVWTFIWCIFMGITVGSIGIGAVLPSANRIAKPFICPDGRMELVTQSYYPSPVETVTTLTWYCVDGKTGIKTELGIFPMSLYAGTIYGLALFVIVFIGMTIRANRRPAQQDAKLEIRQAIDSALKFRSLEQENDERYEELTEKLQADLNRKKK
jgi:hypothetical protein